MNSGESELKGGCCCGKLDALRAACAPLAPLVARIALGAVFVMHGSQKIFGAFGGHGWTGTIGFMHDKLGIPVVFAALAIIAEFFGGLGVLLGLLTRLAAFGIFCVMAVAVFQVHLPNGFFADKHGYEYPLTLGLLALSLIFSGGGPWSLDALVKRCCARRQDGAR
ncbi:MAG: DoxX family protein [Verrucomicrobia bacterium]|nr:DoxX family protein [Verrucomicrobiota bacterium]